MDNYHLGDLADIVRASGSVISATANNTSTNMTTTTTTTTTDNQQMDADCWQQFGSPNPDLYRPFQDPLLHDMDRIATGGGLPFVDMGLEDNFQNSNPSVQLQTPVPVQNNSNCNIFPRAVQISPETRNSNSNSNSNYSGSSNSTMKLPLMVASSRVVKNKTDYGLISTDMMMNMNNGSSSSCNRSKDGFLDSTVGVQIPSPRNPGIKRRKSQAKKVVCIPAPAMANNRQTGEVVPSDLWAWRKYGQKPIKGSPHPRGYYRCSSSKGCSARKQVERSRTDPNMLVITYTSEHNHPWPTQRNALAGSTRSQPSKTNVVAMPSKPSTTTVQPSTSSQSQTATDNNNEVVKGEINDNKVAVHENDNHHTAGRSSSPTSSTKEEELRVDENKNDNNDQEENTKARVDDHLIQSYRPIMAEPNGQQQDQQDYFADLVDFEGDDPLNLLFTQESKALDPFGGLFDWGAPNSSIITTPNSINDHDISTSSGQGKSHS